jgi:putative membrane protein
VPVRRSLRVPLAIGAVALAAGAAGSLASASPHHGVSAFDEHSLMTSIQGDRFEVAGGRLAEAKGSTAEVRALGARLVKDHASSLKDAIGLAHRLGVSVPGAPSPSQRWELTTVAAFSGADFDRRYADLEVLDHEQDIQEAKDEVSEGTNRQVRQAARKELPTLREHLKLSRAALRAAAG